MNIHGKYATCYGHFDYHIDQQSSWQLNMLKNSQIWHLVKLIRQKIHQCFGQKYQ
jgi:hypothetical protein